MSRFPLHPTAASIVIAIALASSAGGARAWADQASASACATTLPPEAMTISRAVAPHVTPDGDLRSLLRTKVKAMVVDGQVQRATARKSADAAYGCLNDLK